MVSESGDDPVSADEPVEEPVQQELAPLDGAERLARIEELREVLEETEKPDEP
jgi:hypothetical protein